MPNSSGRRRAFLVQLPLLLLLAVATLLMSCSPSADSSQKNLPSVEELSAIRGVWVTNVDSEILFDDASIDSGFKALKQRGFDTVFPVVWNDGYTLHPSRVMEARFGAEYAQDPFFAQQGRDPLAAVVRSARAHGLRVIPWFEFGFSSSYSQNGGHILARYPEWAARDAKGGLLTKNGFEWMNAIHPDVQEFITDLVLEVVEGYDIDGIQGDDRLPAMPSEGGYSPFTRELYRQETGRDVPADPREPDFLDWKADKLSAYARHLHQAVKQADPSLIVSFSPSIYPWSKEEYLQDWPAWIESGSVDLLIPQAYRWTIEAYRSTVEEMVRQHREAPGSEKVALLPGIIIKAGSRYNGFEYVRPAIEHNRNLGLQGEVYFFYEGLFEQNGYLADSLRDTFYGVSQE